MDIPVHVVDQKLKISMNYKTIVAGTSGFVRFIFNVSNDWDDLGLVANFKQNGIIYPEVLDEECAVYLPPKITAGVCTLTLSGMNSDNSIVAFTDCVSLTIKENALDDGVNSDSSSGSCPDSLRGLIFIDDNCGNVSIVNYYNNAQTDEVLVDMNQTIIEFNQRIGTLEDQTTLEVVE